MVRLSLRVGNDPQLSPQDHLERARRAGLQQPVIAPFAVGDHVPTYQRAIEAFAR